MTLLEISVNETDGVAQVVLSGELDLSTIERLEQELERLEGAAAGAGGTIAIDLRQLTFLDSSGLRVIVSADQRARRQNRRLVVVRGSEAVQRVFSITRLDEQLEMVESLDHLGG